MRIPDVCLIHAMRHGHADAPREEITKTPQLLCIEILPPDDRISRTTKVLDDFVAMGVENLWIIDPIDRVGYIYQPGGKLQLVTDRLAIPEKPIYLDLFAALD